MTRLLYSAAALAGATLLVPGAAMAATINAQSCAQAAVQTAVNTAANGDTVRVPAGTCTWASGVNIKSKTIFLVGAGSGAAGSRTGVGRASSRSGMTPVRKTGRLLPQPQGPSMLF